MQRIRWPKNYSIFSAGSSDSDSDPQSLGARRSKANRLHIDVSAANSAASSAYPSPLTPSSRPVAGVYLFCSGDQVDLLALATPMTPSTTSTTKSTTNMGSATVPLQDPIFNSEPLAISAMIGYPLLTRRMNTKPNTSLPSPHYQNTPASFLHLDLDGGCKPHPEWTGGVGTVLVVRADKEPLTKELLDRICRFHARLMDVWKQRGGVNLRASITPQMFSAFCVEEARGGAPLNNNLQQSTVLGESWLDVQRPLAV